MLSLYLLKNKHIISAGTLTICVLHFSPKSKAVRIYTPSTLFRRKEEDGIRDKMHS